MNSEITQVETRMDERFLAVDKRLDEMHDEMMQAFADHRQFVVEGFGTLRAEMAAGFALVDGRFDAIEQRLAGHDARLDAIDRRLAGHDARFEAIEQRLDRFEGKLDAFIDMQTTVNKTLLARL